MGFVKVFIVPSLVVVLLVSSMAVIFSKHQSRSLFIDIQKQEKRLDDYEVEWGRLQLELTMLTEENRVERVAQQQLKLIMPEREKIIFLKP